MGYKWTFLVILILNIHSCSSSNNIEGYWYLKDCENQCCNYLGLYCNDHFNISCNNLIKIEDDHILSYQMEMNVDEQRHLPLKSSYDYNGDIIRINDKVDFEVFVDRDYLTLESDNCQLELYKSYALNTIEKLSIDTLILYIDYYNDPCWVKLTRGNSNIYSLCSDSQFDFDTEQFVQTSFELADRISPLMLNRTFSNSIVGFEYVLVLKDKSKNEYFVDVHVDRFMQYELVALIEYMKGLL